jgi:hypothetical protein
LAWNAPHIEQRLAFGRSQKFRTNMIDLKTEFHRIFLKTSYVRNDFSRNGTGFFLDFNTKYCEKDSLNLENRCGYLTNEAILHAPESEHRRRIPRDP